MGKPRVDFYPSTGRWRIPNEPRTYRGGSKAFLGWYARQASPAAPTGADDGPRPADPTTSPSPRPETGPMQFGDDWTGVFFRGDNAAAAAMYLEQVLDAYAAGRKPDPIALLNARGLFGMRDSDERGPRPGLQRCRPWGECLAETPRPVERAPERRITERGAAVRTLWLEIARRLEAWLTESEGDPRPAEEVFRDVGALARSVLVLEPAWAVRIDPFLAALDSMAAIQHFTGARSLRFDHAWDSRSQAAAELVGFIRTTSDTTLATIREEGTAPERFYIVCLAEMGIGETILWWRPRGAGYTRFLDEAGQYTAEEARTKNDGEHTLALSCAEVDALATRVVNHDHLKKLRWKTAHRSLL